MSNAAYLAIVTAFAAGLTLVAAFYRPEYGDMLARTFSKQEQPRWPRGCWRVDEKTKDRGV